MTFLKTSTGGILKGFSYSGDVTENQRLGLHVTSQELAIWQDRMTDNVNGIHGFTFQNIYENRILLEANLFVAEGHPNGDGHWEGYTGAGCAPNTMNPGAGSTVYGRGNGIWMMRSAFVFLLTGDTDYADPVRSELVQQISETGTDFSNASKWCPGSSLISSQNTLEILPWLNKLMYSFDYLRAGGYSGWSGSEEADIMQWFVDSITAWKDAHVAQAESSGSFPGMYDDPADYTCVGADCSNNRGLLYQGGPTSKVATDNWFNDIACIIPSLCMGVGLMSNTQSLIDHAVKYFTAFMTCGIFDNGAIAGYDRWNDCTPDCPGSMWAHAGGSICCLIAVADMYARSGDTSLYDMTKTTQVLGGSGGTVGLELVLELWANCATGAANLLTGDGDAELTFIETFPNPDRDFYQHFSMMAANMYYQNSTITGAMEQALLTGSGSDAADCFEKQFGGCWSGEWTSWPDLPFMFGELNGVVDPYP